MQIYKFKLVLCYWESIHVELITHIWKSQLVLYYCESIYVLLITPIQVFTFYSWWGRAKLWGWMGRRSSLTGTEQNVPGTNVLKWSKNTFKILLGKKFKIKLAWMYHKGRPLKVFCCARQASKCSHFLLTTVTCTQLVNIFLPSSFCSQACAFLFYLHYKIGFKSCLQSDVTEMKSKKMPECWWGLWLTGTSLVAGRCWD